MACVQFIRTAAVNLSITGRGGPRVRMESIYHSLKTQARKIAAQHPPPSFYRHFFSEHTYAASFLERTPFLSELRNAVADRLNENLGHGSVHAEKVAVDAGTLIIIEGHAAGCSRFFSDRLMLQVQTAALLHDICRVENNHAQKGAVIAREYLSGAPFTETELNHICRAIHNHEAFKQTLPSANQAGRLVSDCLYDADKFRWGKDNFSFTLWDMLDFSKVPVGDFIASYSDGMNVLEKVRGTFRTRTGKQYGPRFIDIGLSIGRELQMIMETEFGLM